MEGKKVGPYDSHSVTSGMHTDSGLASTGIPGLDDVLGGGLPRERVMLLEGNPGSGKTTLAMRFLLEGVARGERCLHVTLGESADELQQVAISHGWSLDGIRILELTATEAELDPSATYTVFDAADVELEETMGKILRAVEEFAPQRLVIDSLSEFRLLAESSLRYRHQTLALKQFFGGRGCTVLLIDDRTSGKGDLDLHSITHGVISLEQLAPEFGGARRRLRVLKMRAQAYHGGWHDFNLERGGVVVFQRLVASEQAHRIAGERLESGVAALDVALGGGIDRGTATMLIGPSGTGKSTIAAQYAASAAANGERAAFFLFDERPATFLTRLDNLGIGLRPFVEAGTVTVQLINPAELSPSEFTASVQAAVEPQEGPGASIVVIDSLNGYLLAMPEDRFLNLHLHELLTYLGQLGVATFTTNTQSGLLGLTNDSTIDASYLADTVIALRYYEVAGEICQAIAVVKRRTGDHERTLRRMWFDANGINISEPLREYRGLLTGVPVPVAQKAEGAGNGGA